jgi:hypothetical protein
MNHSAPDQLKYTWHNNSKLSLQSMSNKFHQFGGKYAKMATERIPQKHHFFIERHHFLE